MKVALLMPKEPRTFEIIMWRTVKPTSLCEGSSSQVPGLYPGMSMVFVVVMMSVLQDGPVIRRFGRWNAGRADLFP